MPAYDFGYGYQQPRERMPRQGGPGSYGYAPQYGYQNPFASWRPDESMWNYYNQNPEAVIGQYLGANQVSGPQGVAQNFRTFLEGWLPDAYKQYTGWNADNPETSFADYLGTQDPMNAFEMTNPSARGLRATYRTRFLRR
jgi:hypothetical protein